VLGVEEGREEVGVETADEVAGERFLVHGHPSVAEGLQEQGDAVASGRRRRRHGRSSSPSAVLAYGVHDDAEVFLGETAELGQLRRHGPAYWRAVGGTDG
jgi:hypothetical protein